MNNRKKHTRAKSGYIRNGSPLSLAQASRARQLGLVQADLF